MRGAYFDGASSRKQPALLRWSASSLTVLPDEGERVSVDLTQLRLESPLPGTPARMSWGEGQSFVSFDVEGLLRMRRDLSLDQGWAARLERNMSAVLAAAVLCVALLAVIAVWGVPTLAARMAHFVPAESSDQLAEVLLAQLEPIMEPSALAQTRQRELARYFTSHEDDSDIRLEFRGVDGLGPNAFTLSATTMAFTDELVSLADRDEELLAVYFHELGHARLKHVEQRLLSASAWLLMFGLMTGDFGVVGDTLLSAALLGPAMSPYSRKMEREADAYAIDRLLEAGISPQYFISIMEKLEFSTRFIQLSSEADSSGESSTSSLDSEEISTLVNRDRDKEFAELVLENISSHPPTPERIAYARSRMAEFE